jgi:hypothetical protein
MKYKVNIKRRKKTKKNMAPTVFEPGSYGCRGRAPFHWSSYGGSSLLCHQLYLSHRRAAFHPRSIKAVFPQIVIQFVPKIVTPLPTSPPLLRPPRAPSPPPRTPRAAAIAGGGKMTMGMIKNHEHSARASNQKQDPAIRRFTRALHGMVVRRPSAASTGVGGS